MANSSHVVPSLTAFDTDGELRLWQLERRRPQGAEVYIRIQFCGICRSDLHQLRGEWSIPCHYPMTPGHEIVGLVEEVGPTCTKFRAGDRVGVGCFVGSCGTCDRCQHGEQNYCDKGFVATYNAQLPDGRLTHGGYSGGITVAEEFVVRVPDALPFDVAAPLLCAGITTYSPLVHFGAKAAGPNFHVGVMGLGGLGHVAVKLAKAMGNRVTAVSRGERKSAFAARLGAAFVNSADPAQMQRAAQTIDLMIDTISADHPVVDYLPLLKTGGTLVLVGLPPNELHIPPFAIVGRRLSVAGSAMGGMPETQEMLDFCAAHRITVDVELLDAKDINHALHRLDAGENEAGRFVIRIAETLSPQTQVEPEPKMGHPPVLAAVSPPEANKQATKGKAA